jgi:anti-sigma regulatory factor (Ser/Thr protein kinase)
MRQITLTIESDIQNLSLVAVAVRRICEYLGAGSEESDEIELCVNEAVANCIHHAYLNTTGQPVAVRILASSNEIQCDVTDRGLPMPAASVETLAKSPEDAQSFHDKNILMEERGRGLKIIASLMDEVTYLREGTTNCLRMKKRIKRSNS